MYNDSYYNSVSLEGMSVLTHCECSSLSANRAVCLKKSKNCILKLCSHNSNQVRYFILEEKGCSQRRVCYYRHSNVQSKPNFWHCSAVFILHVWLWSFFGENITKQVYKWLFFNCRGSGMKMHVKLYIRVCYWKTITKSGEIFPVSSFIANKNF